MMFDDYVRDIKLHIMDYRVGNIDQETLLTFIMLTLEKMLLVSEKCVNNLAKALNG